MKNKLCFAKKEAGFSLLEILIAFSIFAVAISILLRIFSAGVTTATVAEDYIIAVQIAESLLARTGVDEKLASGGEGQENEYFNWEVKIIPANLEINNELPKSMSVTAVQVDVSVNWDNERGNGRTVHLTTVKLMPNN